MKHLGDITLIKGYEAPVVDCIIGGSPCQDLSLAGKRAGLAGARSGLYMEQIRIIKEMRERDIRMGRTDVDVRPRYMVWENVPGAFSTNGGQDFAAVLEEAIRVAEPEAPNVDVPEKGWPTAGCFFDEMGKWSVAWRVLDAQFWGTSDKPLPQRRRRIALVADFAGLSASEILFVRKSVSGDIEPGKPKGKEAPGDAGEGSGGAIPYTLKIRGGCEGGGKGALIQDDKSATLSTLQDQTLFQPVTYGIGSYHSNAMKSDNPHSGIYEAETSRTLDALNCGYPGCNQGGMAVVQPVTFEPGIASREGGHVYNDLSGTLRANAGDNQMAVAYSIENHPAVSRVDIDDSGKVQTLTSRMGTGGGNVPMVMESVGYEMQSFGQYKDSGIASALKARDFKDATDLVVAGVDCRNATEYPEMNGTIQAKASGGFSLNCNQVVRVKHIVRRLTPLECERLQGFPDGWTDIGEWVDSKGKKHKEADSLRYKALGNSIAIPPWKWVLKRLCACYERDATMASLFDGIGGFPYIWEQLNGKGSCLWASEIEEFPMAVTKLRFGGETSYLGTGGGNAPMIQEPIAYNGANITSPVNVTNPQPGDPCHTLSVDSRNYVVLPVSKWIDSLGDFKCPVCGGVSEYATKHCPDCGEKMMLGGSDIG